MFKVEIVQDEHQKGVRWLKASHNGVAWSLIEFRSNEEAIQIVTALQQSVQATKACCICVDFLNNNPDPTPNPDCPIHGAGFRA